MSNPIATQPADNTIERSDVTRTLNMVKAEVGLLFTDAARKRPFYAASPKEAQAKLSAALKALDGFSASLDAIKKR